MAKGKTNGGAGGSGKSEIIVYAPTGSTVTVQRGTETPKTAAEKNGVWTFKNCDIGTWTVHASLGDQSATATVEITEEGQLMRYEVTISYVHIYGIKRDITQASPLWERTDEAVGIVEPTASVGTQAGQSVFDNFYPWSGIHRETLSTGDVMVKIPRFWFRRYREGNIEYIKIANTATDGFALHPAFNHANVPRDCIYVGAYETGTNNKSVSGVSLTSNMSLNSARSQAKTKGVGWYIWTASVLSAIQMLFLVEFATYDSQSALGDGYYIGSNANFIATGNGDNVPNLTGSTSGEAGKATVVYRGIENLYGNYNKVIDGLLMKVNSYASSGDVVNSNYYVCNDPDLTDNTTNYTQLSYGAKFSSTGYIKQLGLDAGPNTHILVAETKGGSSNTYICDATWNGNSSGVFYSGRIAVHEDAAGGLFRIAINKESSATDPANVFRLIYIPQEVVA